MAPRIPRPAIGDLQPMADSFEISLNGSGKSDKTREIYLDAVARFGGHLLSRRPAATWYEVGRQDIELWIVWLREQDYSASYVNQLYRSVQQFFKWFSDEEEVPDPFAKMRPPKPDEKIVPVLPPESLAALVKDAEKGRDFKSRRDAAILRLFASTGSRLAEIGALGLVDVNLQKREAVVTGKGSRQRTVKFDHKTAQSLDRYLRLRKTHKLAELPHLWVGLSNQGGLQAKSIYRMIVRRGAGLGMKIHPHMFRHTFSHNWLDKGGAEGDLMELNGWTSAQMLRRYGASARSARAKRAYDRIDVMDGI